MAGRKLDRDLVEVRFVLNGREYILTLFLSSKEVPEPISFNSAWQLIQERVLSSMFPKIIEDLRKNEPLPKRKQRK